MESRAEELRADVQHGHASVEENEEFCLPPPVDSICGWNIAYIIAFQIFLVDCIVLVYFGLHSDKERKVEERPHCGLFHHCYHPVPDPAVFYISVVGVGAYTFPDLKTDGMMVPK